MKVQITKSLYNSAHLHNILPLTSTCNANCVFCSHRQNPRGIGVCAIPPLSAEEIEDLMLFLSPSGKIVIGESATSIVEGEPFTHPDCIDVLKKLRKRFPTTLIQITTNGKRLACDTVRILKSLEPLELNLSLNSASAVVRRYLMNDNQAAEAIKAVSLLHEAGVIFHGSLVAMPWLTGWEDIKKTIDFLEAGGACTIRAFIPGFTRYRLEEMAAPVGWEKELREFLAYCRSQIKCPLTIEPPALTDLRAKITGVIRGSRAACAGMEPGQEILAINGTAPFSRVDAFNKLNTPGKHLVTILKKGLQNDILLETKAGESNGLVMDCDLSLETVLGITRITEQKKALNPVVLASEWGAPLLQEGLYKLGKASIEVRCVKNIFWGGTIRSAGLLMVEDFARSLKNEIEERGKPELVLLPALAFDYYGKDLQGVPYHRLAEMFDTEVRLVEA